MTESALQNSLQAAAKGSTTNVPYREVYEFLKAHPGQAYDCNAIATHFNVIGYAKDKIAKDLSSIYLKDRQRFERDTSRFPYFYTLKATNGAAQETTPVVKNGAELFLAKRVMKHLGKHNNQYFSPKEIGEAMGISAVKIAGALGSAFRTQGSANGLLRIANGISFKYAVNRKKALFVTQLMEQKQPIYVPGVPLERPGNVVSLSTLIAETLTLDERSRNTALKIAQLMAALSPMMQADFLEWARTLGSKSE